MPHNSKTKKVKAVKIKQIETFEMLGVRYLTALSEDGLLYQTTFGSGEWKVYPVPYSLPHSKLRKK